MSQSLIIVNTSRETIDPQGLASDEEVAFVAECILDAVRAEWPEIEVLAGASGSRTSGRDAEGNDISRDVQRVVDDAYNTALQQA